MDHARGRHPSALHRPLLWLESVGRAVADLGFSGVIEKFEEHWGRRTTRWLLLVIGLGVSAICVGAIWQWIVSPILAFLDSPQRSGTIWSLALAFAAIAAGVTLASALAEALTRWRRMRRIRAVFEETKRESESFRQEMREGTDQVLGDARAILGEAVDLKRRAETMLELSILAVQSAIEADQSLSPEEKKARLANMDLALEVISIPQNEGQPPEAAPDHRSNSLRHFPPAAEDESVANGDDQAG